MNEAPENTPAAATPGEQLKQAREHAGLSIERVAKDLYLDSHVISAIEINHFKELGAPVYAKGYIRKYARLVGVPEEDVLRRYLLLGDVTTVADPIPAAMGSVPESRKPLPGWILWVVAGLIVLAAAATLLNMRSSTTETSNQGVLISQPLAPDTTVSSPLQTGVEGAGSSTAAPLSLLFRFTGDSWVEVYDANNQQVLYDMGTVNSSREVTAVPPLRVVLGAAGVVKVQVNSQDVVVPAKNVDAGIGRFVVTTKGTLE